MKTGLLLYTKYYYSLYVQYSLRFLTLRCALYRSFGGCVSWESHDAAGATYDEQDDTITHQIVDRPSQRHVILSR